MYPVGSVGFCFPVKRFVLFGVVDNGDSRETPPATSQRSQMFGCLIAYHYLVIQNKKPMWNLPFCVAGFEAADNWKLVKGKRAHTNANGLASGRLQFNRMFN